MSQNASDYIPVCLPNEPARTRIREALNFLSRRCDHAHQRDGHGFNKYDSPHGKEWAAAFESGGVASLEPFKLKAAHRMLQKYHRQLAEGRITDSRNKRSRGLNLINTAVSRAKKWLVIVCNKSWWLERRGQLIRALLLAGEDATQNLY